MTVTQIYIGDDLLDLFPNTLVAQTLKANELGSVSTVFRNNTNQFKIPFTENNNRILSNANVITSEGSVQYSSNTCRIIQNGVTIVSNGRAVIKEASDHYSMFVLSGVSIFDAIGNKRLYELDFTGGINGQWGQATAQTFANTTTGIISPVIDYGTFTTSPNDMGDAYELPSIYYHTIVDKIFTDAGYAKSGAVFSEDKYLKTIFAFSKGGYEYSQKFCDDRSASASNSSPQVITVGSATPVHFPDVIVQDPKGFWDSSTHTYTAVDADATTNYRLFQVRFTLTIDVTIAGGTVDFFIHNESRDLLTGVGTGSYTAVLPDPIDYVLARDAIGLQIRTAVNTGAPTLTVNSARIDIECLPTAIGGTQIHTYFNELLPDITQKQVLADLMVRFGQVIKEEDGTVYFKGLEEIIADKAGADDWTEKAVRDSETVTFATRNIAQNNYYRYSNADDFIPADWGEANLTVDNNALDVERFIVSPFSGSLTKVQGGNSHAKIRIYDTTSPSSVYDFDNDPGVRILLVRDKYSEEAAVTYFSSTSSYKVAYFHDPKQANTMKYEQTLEDDLALYQAALQKTKIVTKEYYLDESDIANMDFFKLVFDKDSYYLKDTITNYVPNKLTKVRLLKI